MPNSNDAFADWQASFPDDHKFNRYGIGGFTPRPIWIDILERILPPLQVKVLAYVAKHSYYKFDKEPTSVEISYREFQTGKMNSIRSIQDFGIGGRMTTLAKSINELEALGLLHCDRGTSHKSNAYTLPKNEIAIEIVCDLIEEYLPKACHLLKIFYPQSKDDFDNFDV